MVESETRWVIELDEEERNYLLNLLKRRQLYSDSILAKKGRYSKFTYERMAREFNLATQILEKLGNKTIVLRGKPLEKSGIEDRLKKLEMKVEQLEVIVKKLVAYHKGEIS